MELDLILFLLPQEVELMLLEALVRVVLLALVNLQYIAGDMFLR